MQALERLPLDATRARAVPDPEAAWAARRRRATDAFMQSYASRLSAPTACAVPAVASVEIVEPPVRASAPRRARRGKLFLRPAAVFAGG